MKSKKTYIWFIFVVEANLKIQYSVSTEMNKTKTEINIK